MTSASPAVTAPTVHTGRPNVLSSAPAMELDWVILPMPRDAPTANRANTAPSLPPCFRPKAASSAYMGPPTHWPCRSRRRYRTARKLSAKMVAMPNRADSSIHTNAPGPPAARAVATPTMFPVPMLAARAVIRAEKGDTPSRPVRRASRPRAERRAKPSRRQGSSRIRTVRNTPVPSSSARVPGPHSNSLTAFSIPCPLLFRYRQGMRAKERKCKSRGR